MIESAKKLLDGIFPKDCALWERSEIVFHKRIGYHSEAVYARAALKTVIYRLASFKVTCPYNDLSDRCRNAEFL